MNNQNNNDVHPFMNIHHIQLYKTFLKDLSFEVLNIASFMENGPLPQVKFEIRTESLPLPEKGFHELLIFLSCTASEPEKPCFKVELKMAGIFDLSQVNDSDLAYALGVLAPRLLYPYAREAVTQAVAQGGFPPLILSTVNFDYLHEQRMSSSQKSDLIQ